MTLQEYLASRRYLLPLFKDVYDNDVLEIVRADCLSEPDFIYVETRLTDTTHRRFLSELFRTGGGPTMSSFIDLYCITQLVGAGPKVFRPTIEECLALEEVQVRIPMSAYSQPFPTFAIEFPKEYRSQRYTSASGGRSLYSPIAQVLSHDKNSGVILATTLTDSEDWSVLCGIIGSPQSATIEDDIMRRLPTEHSEAVNDRELEVERRAVRVALNACLLLMDRGFCKMPHCREADALSRQLKSKKTLSKVELESIRGQRQSIPTEYAMTQSVDVRRIIRGEVSDATVEEALRRKMKPHWRSAHWRMQKYGPGLTLSKRLLIPHCMVNKADFGGDESETFVVQS